VRGVVVPPRAYAPESGAALPLDGLIDPAGGGVVGVVGGPGAGKTTAVGYLRRRCESIAVLDEPSLPDVRAIDGPVVYAARAPLRIEHRAVLHLAPWGHDELLQYLEARWPDRLRSVMGRILKARDRDLPAGVPELWCAVLDAMARDGDVSGVREAWRRTVPEEARRATGERAFRMIVEPRRTPQPDLALLRHAPFRDLFAAEHVVASLREGDYALPPGFVTPALLRETARLADDGLVARLEAILARRRELPLHPLAASVVFAAKPDWRPPPQCLLKGGRFPRARWAGLEQTGCDLRETDLAGADLSRARFGGALLTRARLSGARLNDADLEQAKLMDADLARADLAGARAGEAGFDGADLTRAILEGGRFRDALFCEADLRWACCAGADFSGANLSGAALAEADFSHARFEGAALSGADLRRARWTGATFPQARLVKARLDGLSLAGANLAEARLVEARLTGTDLEAADLRGASLRGARAGNVHLLQADLRGADLRDVVFSRSTHAAPEDVRAANLCGADLRGARIEGTDLWRVDLRGARLDPDQRDHARRCGALL